MREIEAKKIIETVRDLCIQANYELPDDVLYLLNEALKKERSATAREVIRELISNADIAKKLRYPICQDTGLALVFVELGQGVMVSGGDLIKAVNEGVSRGYKEGYLRKSVVHDPFLRKNTNDNTPALIHTDIVPGDKIKITFMAKGGGCENVGAYKMFKPGTAKEEIEDFVVETVKAAGPNSCPPIIVGIGIGGNQEKSALLAKKALLREAGKFSSNKETHKMEKEILVKINDLGIGAVGLGGTITALGVHIETAPCHIASLPVTVSIDCHAHRVKEIII
jgi:fumarate hydratase subunit alpha